MWRVRPRAVPRALRACRALRSRHECRARKSRRPQSRRSGSGWARPSCSSRIIAVRIGVRETFRRSTSASSDSRSPALSSPLRISSRSFRSALRFWEDGPSTGSAFRSRILRREAVYNLPDVNQVPSESSVAMLRRNCMHAHAVGCGSNGRRQNSAAGAGYFSSGHGRRWRGHHPGLDVFHHLRDDGAPAVVEAHFLVLLAAGLVAVDGGRDIARAAAVRIEQSRTAVKNGFSDGR